MCTQINNANSVDEGPTLLLHRSFFMTTYDLVSGRQCHGISW